jgi:hypothetical protein
MLFKTSVGNFFSYIKKVQQEFKNIKGVTSRDILRLETLSKEAEKNLRDLCEIPHPPVETVTDKQIADTLACTYNDTLRIIRNLSRLPNTRDFVVDFIKISTSNQIVENNFTNKKGHIKAVFGNDKEIMYLVQYEDLTFGAVKEKSLYFL